MTWLRVPIIGCMSLVLSSACTAESGSIDTQSSTAETSGSTSADAASGDGDGGPGDGDGTPAGCTPELEALRTDIFTPSCTAPGCHAAADAAGGLNLEAADLEAELVGAPSGTCDGWVRVIPGAPDESLLYLKISNAAPCGAPMPPPAGLPNDQSLCVRAWIEGLQGSNCETCGGDACIDLTTDTDNCGACGNVCPAGTNCEAGVCTCPNGQDLCDGSCIDTLANHEHCGSCGNACAANKVCWQGVCADTCAALTECDGGCIDTTSDPFNCGACGNACPNGGACVMGGCDCPGNGVAFAADVEPLFGGCDNAGCHGFPVPAAGLDLRPGQLHASTVGVPSSQCVDRLLVSPGQAGASYLLDKLQGSNLCSGTKMPKAGPGLTPQQIEIVSEWICRGALDN
jgi:hypothetical protein